MSKADRHHSYEVFKRTSKDTDDYELLILSLLHDIGKSKTETAKKKLRGINPECNIDTIPTHLDSKNINKYLHNSSLVISISSIFIIFFPFANFGTSNPAVSKAEA